MPIYEFICKRCQHPFEELVIGSESIACPSCGADEPVKQLSAFAVGHDAPAPALPGPGGCGTCGDPRGPGACSMN